jgi:hypothetical protein
MTTPEPSLTEAQLRALQGDGLTRRSCGGCVECCVALHVDLPELQKPPGVPCRHLTGGGCGIYDSRPSLCRVWHCLWRRTLAFPDLARPDRCGVIFSLQPVYDLPWRDVVVARALNSMDDFETPVVRAALDLIVESEQFPVDLVFRYKHRLLFPEAELADAILYPQLTPHAHLLERADRLRRQWVLAEQPPS